MAVPAIELRPRSALQLFDAAIRLTARSSGVWSITLPAGALVTGALLEFVDAVTHVRPVTIPTLLLTLAWLLRAISQGAACHHLESELIGEHTASVRASYKAALRRAPSLFITAAFNFFFNLITLPLTLGMSLLFLSSHIVGYAVAMQGKGHPLAVYGTAGQMLGKARGHTSWVRALFFTQGLVILNLHIAATFLIYLGRKLLGMDLTFADRFVSIDNGVWVSVVVALGFTLFEPLRAATSTLLLIDGRVRQEGLDLLAVIDQLPRKRPRAPVVPVAPIVALLFALLSTAADAEPRNSPAELRARVWAAGTHCGMKGEKFREQIAAVEEVAKNDPTWIGGLAEEVDALTDEDSCERILERLQEELPLILDRRDSLRMKDLDKLAHGDLSGDAKVEAPLEGSALRARFWAVGTECGMKGKAFRDRLEAVEKLSATNHTALSRSLARVEALAYEDGDCEAAHELLEKDLQWIEKTRAVVDKQSADAASQKAKEILSRPEFRPDGVLDQDTAVTPPKEDEEAPGWWHRFLEWLKKLFNEEPRSRDRSINPPTGLASGQVIANILIVVLVAGLVLALGYIILSVRARRRATDEGGDVTTAKLQDPTVDPDSALSRAPESWASLADQLAREGRFREAVRSLYLALLSRLHRDGAIDYDPAKSNWEYFRGFKGKSEWLSPFKELTRRFDYAWYGNEDVSDGGYENFRELAKPMLTAQEPANA